MINKCKRQQIKHKRKSQQLLNLKRDAIELKEKVNNKKERSIENKKWNIQNEHNHAKKIRNKMMGRFREKKRSVLKAKEKKKKTRAKIQPWKRNVK